MRTLRYCVNWGTEVVWLPDVRVKTVKCGAECQRTVSSVMTLKEFVVVDDRRLSDHTKLPT